ncbi:Vitellogenin-6 [Hypsibius exemplaris]|uniref:Vitellogenin-6 n=1 Tax=Hypsibius exemplaris TaxID=2072580 RepID=A0A1W0WQU7_HYPEX|nr:Vitellogenin-6 [Hypsibius exemplaris]
MIVAPLLLSVLALAGAQYVRRQPSDLASWSTEYPELITPRISERVFRENKEYRYLYDGQILTGLPETADQYSGLRIRAIVTVQLRSGVDVLKIEKATLGRLNERTVEGPLNMQHSSLFEELTGEEAKEWNTALTKPIRFQYDDSTGAVSDLVALESDPFWSVNIKRSILATFNLKLKSQTAEILSHPRFPGSGLQGRLQQQSPSQLEEDTQYFSVMEEGIGGECEAVYLVQSLPSRDVSQKAQANGAAIDEVLNVTKTWNYDNCRSRPITLESLNSGAKCVGKKTTDERERSGCGEKDTKKENIINSASETRYSLIGTADDFMIESAVTEAVHKFAPYSDKAGSITAYVNATLRLIYAGEHSRNAILPTEQGLSLRGLRQLLPEDQDDEYRRQSFLESSDPSTQLLQSRQGAQWPNVAAKKTIIKALLDRLVEDLADSEVEPESANLVLQMSVILGYATHEEIAEIHREVKGMARQSFEQDQIENLWFDVLALTGTKPAVLYIKREILSGNLKGERAAQLLNTLAFSIAKPDQDIVQEVMTLCKQSAVAADSGMKKACWLSFGTLAHASCVDDVETIQSVQNNAVKNGSPKCDNQSRQRLVIELLSRMKTSQDQEDQILLLKTIGNTGFVEAVRDLKTIIEDKQQPIIIRINAIYALTRVAAKYPELIQSVVLPIFHDQTNHFQVRIAAFDLAIEAEADLPDLQQIARSLHKEKSKQVGSYVWSKLNSLANATHPCFEEISDNAALALEFGTPFNTGLTYSKSIHLDGFSDALQVGGFAEVETIGDPSSIIPRQVSVRLNAHILGLSHDVMEAGVETTGISALIKKFAMSRGKQSNVLAELFGDYDNEGQDYDDEDRRQAQQQGRSAERRSARKSYNRPEFDEFDRILGLSDRKDEEIQASAFLKIFGHEVRFMTLSPKAILTAIGEAYLKPSELAGLARGVLPIDHRKALMAADAELTIPTELGLPLTVELKAPVVVSVKGTVGLKTQPELSMASLLRTPQAVTVESDVKVSIATELHAKMNVWAAYMKIGAGIRAQVSTVIPLNGDLIIDLKSGKIETTMDIPQEPLELIKVEVMPITYTKVVPKTLVPHQPDRQDPRDQDRSEKIVQFNQQPLDNQLPTEFFRFKTDLMENPWMLSNKNGRPSSKFYEGLPVPVLEIKEISTFDILKTKTVSMRVGHPAAGFVVDVEGQWQTANGVPNVPLLPVGGKTKVLVTLRPAQSGLKAVSAALHFRQERALPSSLRPTWNKLFDQMVNYNTANLLERLGSDLPAAFAKDDKSAFSAQVIIKGHSDSRQETVAMQGVFSLVRGLDGKFVKVAAELTSQHPGMPYQACVNGHAQYPEEYDAWNQAPGTNKPVTGRFEVAVGRSCNAPDAMKVKVALVGEKSPAQLALEKNDVYSIKGSVIPQIVSKTIEPLAYMLKPVWQECDADRKQGARWSPACETVKDLYSQLMQLKIDIDYQNIPRALKVCLDKAEQMTHALFQWNSDVDNVDIQNQPNHVTIWANFSSTEDLVDLVYSTPKKNAKLVGLPVPYPLGPIEADDEPLNFLEALLDEDLDDMCSASGNRINTLDSAKIRVTPSRCWALLAKDCSQDELWSVLYAQAGSRGADGKKVVVYIGEDKIELQPANAFASGKQLRSSADVTVLVNGRKVQLSEQQEPIEVGQDNIEISLETDGDATAPYVAISAEQFGLVLWYDGHNIALKPTAWLRKQVCGLCGNNNGEQWDDMTLPNGQLAGNDEDLFSGYTARQGGCEAEQYTESRSAQQAKYPFARDQQECGQLKTIVKSRPGKVCFSVDPVEMCPAGCNGGADQEDSSEDYIQVRRAGFHCLPENSSRAQQLAREARTRVLSEISMKPVTDYFVVPQSQPGCSSVRLG